MDSQGKCFDRCSFASLSSFSTSVFRFQSSRMGSFSRGKVCVGNVVSCSATRTHQFARDESCHISVTTFLVSKTVVLATNNTKVVAYLQNQGRTRCHTLFLLWKEILLLCLLSHIHLVVRHIPWTFNVLADCLSRFHNPVNIEWELRQVVFDSVVLRWDRLHVDLFATSLNHTLETFVSPVPDPLSFAVDAMSLSWDGVFAYAFPPFRFRLQVLLKIKQSDCKIILIAPAWPKQAWLPELLLLSCARPLKLPLVSYLLL